MITLSSVCRRRNLTRASRCHGPHTRNAVLKGGFVWWPRLMTRDNVE